MLQIFYYESVKFSLSPVNLCRWVKTNRCSFRDLLVSQEGMFYMEVITQYI